MSRPWIAQEPGPDCVCGGPTVVMQVGDTRFVLMCFFHSRAEGAMFPLPAEAPDDWPMRSFEEYGKLPDFRAAQHLEDEGE